MVSSLNGIYSAQRALTLNQSAIDIVSSNIANMNTEGYSKQRIEVEQLSSVGNSGSPEEAAQNNMGAIISNISRNRDVFLDNYYRKENTDLKFYEELTGSALMLEDMVSELGDTGLNHALDEFYNSLHQLAAHPTDFVIRNNVIQKALDITNKFQSTYSQIESHRESLVGDYTDSTTLSESKIKLSIDELNNKLNSIATLNKDIAKTTVQGITPNHLLDERDKLLDSISEFMPFEISKLENGAVRIRLEDSVLVSGSDVFGSFKVISGDANNPATVQIVDNSGGVAVADASSIITSGKVAAMLEVGGSDATKLNHKSILDNLNTLALEFANAINSIQNSGSYIDSATNQLANASGTIFENFFVDDVGGTSITAANIQVNTNIETDPYGISAAEALSATPTTLELNQTGDGNQALAMAQVRNAKINFGGVNATTEGYVTKIVGDLGNKSASIQDSYELKDSITTQVRLKRENLVGVNLDEELADLVRYQRAYEASARIFNTIDRNLQTIINLAR